MLEPRGCWLLDPLLLLGILLTLSWVPLAGLDGALVPVWVLDPLCSVRLWVLTLGHCLGFGVLFTRSLNIYTLLIHRQLNDRWSCWPVAAMFLLDVFVLSCWQILDPLRRAEHVLEGRLFSDCCASANTDLWLTALYAYKAPMMGLGCFIACSITTRKDVVQEVTQEVTRESRRLALSVCAAVATSALGALGSLLSSHQPQLHFLLPSLAILTGTASLLLLGGGVNAKPGPAVPREPEPPVAPGELSLMVPPAEAATPQSSPGGHEEMVQLLTSNNQQLRRRRMQLDEEIEAITMEIDSTPPPDHQISDHSYTNVTARPVSQRSHPDAQSRGGPAVQRCGGPSTAAQSSCQNPPSTPGTRRCRVAEELNSPEHVRRRLSMQLPILHHAYLPVIGGMATSCSSLLGSPDACTGLPAVSQV